MPPVLLNLSKVQTSAQESLVSHKHPGTGVRVGGFGVTEAIGVGDAVGPPPPGGVGDAVGPPGGVGDAVGPPGVGVTVGLGVTDGQA